MIPDDAESNVDFLLLVGRFSVFGKGGGVGFSGELPELGENGRKNVGVVVGNGFREIGESAGRLHDGGDPLETHPGIDVLGGECAETSISVRVELYEDEIPDLDA